MPTLEIVRLDGPANVRGFDVSIAEHETVQVQLERSNGSVIVSLAVVGPRSLASLPFDEHNRPVFEVKPPILIHVPRGQSVVLKANRQVSGMIWTTDGDA